MTKKSNLAFRRFPNNYRIQHCASERAKGERSKAMLQAKPGDTVKVHYSMSLQDGKLLNSSTSGDLLRFTVGTGRVIPGFEQAIIGMSPGDTKKVAVPAEQAFGPYRKELVAIIDRSRFPEYAEVRVGQKVRLSRRAGQKTDATVTAISGSSVRVDGNHPLAGKDLKFEIHLLGIQDTVQE
jgi:peptidylprolyl isomerase